MGRVCEDCVEEKHWKGERKGAKTKWELLPEYHPTARAIEAGRRAEEETKLAAERQAPHSVA